jgi:adenine-specific DNA-methyltransferase
MGIALPSQEELDGIVLEELGMSSNDSNFPQSVQAKRKIEEALDILRALGLPRALLNQRTALTFLALLEIKPASEWSNASNPLYGITEMMEYLRSHYGISYAPNTRETVRRFTVHQFVQLGLVLPNPDNPSRPINSPHTRYQIESNALDLMRTYGSYQWINNLKEYLASTQNLTRLQVKERAMVFIPVKLPNGDVVQITPGGQNVLIKQIIEEFCPRFTPDGIVLYIGDAGDKFRVYESEYLERLGIIIDEHSKMPDIVSYLPGKNWLVLIEAVTSHGAINLKRHNELKDLFKHSIAPLVFVTAFSTRKTMVKYLSEIAWETDVWISESPSHLIHFNGERFLGPYED